MKHLLKFSLMAVGLALLVACSAASNGASEIEAEALAIKVSQELQKGQYQIVSTEELKQWFDEDKDMLIVDTMPYEASYKKQHIPGAVQFEFPIEEINQLDEATRADFEALLGPDKSRTIVFYCGFTKCGRSHNGAMWAVQLGYSDVYRCPGGITAWAEAGYPTEAVDES